jgi:hypothetical protein
LQIVCGVDSAAGMTSDGSTPVLGVGQMNIVKNKVTVALCFALMVILLNDGAEASSNDAKPTFMHLPMRLRNPRGVGLSHQGARTSNSVPGEGESVPEDLGNTFQGDDTIPRISHLPPHMYDPRGARESTPLEEVNVEPVSENQVESATPEVNQVRFSQLPRLHNPRGVNVIKQIQEGMVTESGRQAGIEGDKN